MPKGPSVSIIVPVYKVERFIERSLRSVMAQTYRGDVECLLVDDASPDASMQTARDLIAAYRGEIRFRLLAHERNRGLSAARNTGLDAATGDYVYFLDSDDEMTPHALETLCGIAAANPDVEVVASNAYCQGPYAPLMRRPGATRIYRDAQKARQVYLRGHDVVPTAWNQLVSLPFIRRHGLRFVEGLLHEDNPWRFDVGRHLGSLAVCFEKTYHYHLNDSGIMATVSEARLDSLDAIGRMFMERLDPEMAPEQVRMLLKMHANSTGLFLRGMLGEAVHTAELERQLAAMAGYCRSNSYCPRWDNSTARRCYALGYKALQTTMRLHNGGHTRLAQLLLKGICFLAE